MTQQTIDEKQDAADLRRHGLMSARGNRARDRFDHATYVAERVVSEQEKSADGARKDALQKKKQLFRERIRRRNEQRLAAGEEEIERDSDDSGDGGDQQEDREEVVAAVEAEMSACLGGANISSQRRAGVIRRDASRTGLLTHAQPPISFVPLSCQVIDAATKMEHADAEVERPPPLHRRRHPAPRAPPVAQDWADENQEAISTELVAPMIVSGASHYGAIRTLRS